MSHEREIRIYPLLRGAVVNVSDEDYDYLSQFKWHLNSAGYPLRNVCEDGRRRQILMHREIMNASSGITVDHRDGNPLNNVRENLRFATDAEQQHNKGRCKNGSSQFKGVHMKTTNVSGVRYVARIKHKGKSIYIGVFDSEEDAARAYDAKAVELFGEFARPNFNEKGSL